MGRSGEALPKLLGKELLFSIDTSYLEKNFLTVKWMSSSGPSFWHVGPNLFGVSISTSKRKSLLLLPISTTVVISASPNGPWITLSLSPSFHKSSFLMPRPRASRLLNTTPTWCSSLSHLWIFYKAFSHHSSTMHTLLSALGSLLFWNSSMSISTTFS